MAGARVAVEFGGLGGVPAGVKLAGASLGREEGSPSSGSLGAILGEEPRVFYEGPRGRLGRAAAARDVGVSARGAAGSWRSQAEKGWATGNAAACLLRRRLRPPVLGTMGGNNRGTEKKG
ncbi:hypothetical protein E2562_002006 [Oryza meyeriana var. granulata]|uniref:Uncharacterized protein n=1 Tax=Oryza meyeriana var. granulata TaxID=110450 RepID=A0A6G1C2N3_9ORYZ|nr:hypothetical protein E2562_002006 [Oryza meyeriana var. granulata]